MTLTAIVDPDDPRVASYCHIRERDLVGREGRFIGEGKVVLRVLLDSPYQVESILVLRRRLSGLADGLDVSLTENVYVVDDDIMGAIAGFDVHRGILAIGLRGEEPDWRRLVDKLPSESTIIVCVGISNHDNIGSIFRNAAAFGAYAVLLDATCCDPLYRKALRVSVGGVLKVPFARFREPAQLAATLNDHGFRQIALSPSGAADIASIQPGGRTAIYLGSEGEGLPETLMARMETVRISMSASFDSLNVAAASAIALHRLTSGQPGFS